MVDLISFPLNNRGFVPSTDVGTLLVRNISKNVFDLLPTSLDFDNNRIFYADLVYGLFVVSLSPPYHSTKVYWPSVPSTGNVATLLKGQSDVGFQIFCT